MSHAGERDQIDAVRAFPYGADIQVWAQDDYWASPREWLQQGRGDREGLRFILRREGNLAMSETLSLVTAHGDVHRRQRGLNWTEPFSLKENDVWPIMSGRASRRAGLTA